MSTPVMNEAVLKRLEQKIQETVSNRVQIMQLARSLPEIDDFKSCVLGIATGRLYNAFYYQSKRILGREPTDEEFEEFLVFVGNKRRMLECLW